jgi:hypothetical protein
MGTFCPSAFRQIGRAKCAHPTVESHSEKKKGKEKGVRSNKSSALTPRFAAKQRRIGIASERGKKHFDL